MCVARMTTSCEQCDPQRTCKPTDVGDGRSDSDLDAGVAFLRQLALKELIQLSVKHTIGHELASLGDGTLRGSHNCESALALDEC